MGLNEERALGPVAPEPSTMTFACTGHETDVQAGKWRCHPKAGSYGLRNMPSKVAPHLSLPLGRVRSQEGLHAASARIPGGTAQGVFWSANIRGYRADGPRRTMPGTVVKALSCQLATPHSCRRDRNSSLVRAMILSENDGLE